MERAKPDLVPGNPYRRAVQDALHLSLTWEGSVSRLERADIPIAPVGRVCTARADKGGRGPQEVQMANERDTDRLANELLGALMGSLTKPMAGTGRPQARPQVDEGSMLSTIKEFLTQSLPGTKPQTQPAAPTASQATTAGAPSRPVEWEAMYRRHVREREEMYARHARERADANLRHEQEMEAAMGIRRVAPKEEPKPVAPPIVVVAQAPRPTGAPPQIVPGKTFGRWSVMTENGPKTIIAVSEEQAFREARRHGLTPTAARLTGIHTYTQEELEKAYRSFGAPGRRESQIGEFEKAIKLGLIPETAEFVLLENREWGYRVGTGRVLYKGSELIERLRR